MKENREGTDRLRKEGRGRTYYIRVRVRMSRLRVWSARGAPARHSVPYDAEFAPEDEGGQRDEEQAEEEQRERDQASEERAWCYFSVADGGDCCVQAPLSVKNPRCKTRNFTY